jgi:hypothetical protein
MKSRRRIASPQGQKQGIVPGQTGRLEVVKTALSDVCFGSKADILNSSADVRFASIADIRIASDYVRRSSFGNFAILTAILLASSRSNNFAADRRPGSSSK